MNSYKDCVNKQAESATLVNGADLNRVAATSITTGSINGLGPYGYVPTEYHDTNSFNVSTEKFTILRGSYEIGSRGKYYSLDEVLTSARYTRWMKCGDEYCMPRATWDLLTLYITDDGYADLTPSEFLDRVLAPKENAGSCEPKSNND